MFFPPNLIAWAFSRAVFGTGADGSIRYSGGAWQTDLSGAWVNITSVAGKWTASGAALVLHRDLQLKNVTVPSGATLRIGADNAGEFVTVYVSKHLDVAGTVRAFQVGSSGHKAGASRTTAGSGNSATASGLFAQTITQPAASGAGGGAAAHNGGAGMQRESALRSNVVRLSAPLTVAGTTTAGADGPDITGTYSQYFTFDNVPAMVGADGFPGGAGAQLGDGKGGRGSGSTTPGEDSLYVGALGGGWARISARRVAITGAGIIHANGQNATDAEDGEASANFSIGAGGGGGAGGSGGVLALRYGSLTVDGVDYSSDTENAAVTSRITATGGTGGAGGAGKTNLTSAASLTAWASSTLYNAGTFRRKIVASGGNEVPEMTSFTDPAGQVIESTHIGGGSSYAGWRAFAADANADTVTTWATGGLTGYLGYIFTTGTVITSYAITSRNEGATPRSPKTWTFEGSNNGSDWDVLDSQSNVTDWATTSNVRKEYSFSNSTAYTHYRVNITDGADPDMSYLGVGKLEMISSAGEPATVGHVCTAGGTSASEEPAWPETPGESVTDGGATWITVAEGADLENPAFDGGNGRSGYAGIVIKEKWSL